MLYGAVKDNFGHYYKLHLPTDGRIPAGVQSRQFNDPVSTRQFIRHLEAQESHWRYLTLTLAAHISPHISIEEAICQLLIDGRIQVFDVTDYAKSGGSAGAAFKTNGNTHVQVLPASAQLMLNNTARRFESVEAARAYLTQLNAPRDQLHSLAQENNLIEAGSGRATAEILLDKLAQAIAGGKLIIVETKPNNAPAKKSSEEFLEVHDRLPGNRRPTLGPHVGAPSKKVAPATELIASTAAIEKSAGTEDALTYPVETKPNTAFFWSGKTDGVGGEAVARQIAAENNGTTLEALIENRDIQMPTWDATNPEVVKAWKAVSADYAVGASGTVRAVIGQNLRPGNVWETAELPALIKNPRVDRIITIDPVTKIEKEIFVRSKK